ncbi:unnamed protein product [Moneuplotes crassus]|uniref:Uncharacterized protein n=1 Tax=Euplotes crassus TaxID=5936 RepID=A0AAD1U6X8_EUPCR|nr:unnamed protein product [Moneuplotes crassus]
MNKFYKSMEKSPVKVRKKKKKRYKSKNKSKKALFHRKDNQLAKDHECTNSFQFLERPSYSKSIVPALEPADPTLLSLNMRERSLKWRNKNFKIENKITSTPYRRMQLTKSLQNKKYDFASNFKSKIEYTKSKYIIDHEQRFIEEGRKKVISLIHLLEIPCRTGAFCIPESSRELRRQH